MSDINAEPNDIYVDATGKLWRVVGVFTEPCFVVEEVEHPAVQPAQRITLGVHGLTWQGFKRIHRQPKKTKHAEILDRLFRV